MSKASTRNVYTPLNPETTEIRVIAIEPAASFDDPLICSLKTVSLTEDLAYETISYCWGDAALRATILLSGRDEVDVPASSAAALRCMRPRSGESRIVWLDAICINQDDVEEKSFQVALMGQIYRLAQENLIYLGEDVEGDSQQSINVLTAYAQRIRDAAEALNGDDLDDWQNGHMPDCWDGLDLISTEDMKKLESLYTLRWFTRLWIVQEAALAKTNTCFWGNKSFQLADALLVANVWLVSSTGMNPWENTQGLTSASYMRRCAAKQVSSDAEAADLMDWSDVFSLGRQQSAFDRRDHVFALSGLTQAWRFAGRPLPELIRPDYRKSAEEVFRDATRLELQIEDDYVLGHVTHYDRQDLEAGNTQPSWSVQWDRETTDWVMPPYSRAGRQLPYDDEIPQGLEIESVDDPNLLRVKGFLLGPIVWNSIPMLKSELEEVSTIKSLVHELENAMKECANEPGQGSTSQTQIASLLTCGNLFLDGSTFLTEEGQLAQGLADLLSQVEHDSDVVDETDVADEDNSSATDFAAQFHALAIDKSEGRTFFSTKDGQIGSGPLLTTTDDVLFVMQGGCFAHVLRPKGDHYIYVAAAYVYGMMAGEVFGLGIEAQWVDIR